MNTNKSKQDQSDQVSRYLDTQTQIREPEAL